MKTIFTKSVMKKIQLTYGVFKYSALSQLKNEDTYIMSAMVGLYQGLKYNGNLVRGVKAGVATAVTISVVNGIMNTIQNIDKIKNV